MSTTAFCFCVGSKHPNAIFGSIRKLRGISQPARTLWQAQVCIQAQETFCFFDASGDGFMDRVSLGIMQMALLLDCLPCISIS